MLIEVVVPPPNAATRQAARGYVNPGVFATREGAEEDESTEPEGEGAHGHGPPMPVGAHLKLTHYPMPLGADMAGAWSGIVEW